MSLLEYLQKIFGEEKGKEIYEKINEDKENVLLVDSKDKPKYVDKDKLDAAEQTTKDYKKQLKDRDKQIEEIQGKVKDNEELSKEIEKLKEENTKASEEYEKKLKQIDFDTKFEKALSSHKPKNIKAIKALIDMEKIKLDGENLLGFDDQIKALKESDDYLFEEDVKGGTGTIGNPKDKEAPTETIGAKLAKQRAENLQSSESNFFKIN